MTASGTPENYTTLTDVTVTREKDWLLARIGEKLDLTLRALLKELAERGLVVSDSCALAFSPT
jgi:hypothetical protein